MWQHPCVKWQTLLELFSIGCFIYGFIQILIKMFLAKVSRDDAKQLEASLENELFRKWEEKFESSYSRSIPIKEIDQFLDAMQAGFEGTLNVVLYCCY